jgi:hypothetical protein
MMAFCTCAVAEEPKTVTIPLDQIWAWDMPGTRDIGQLEPNKPAKVAYGPLVGDIRRALAMTSKEREEAKPGFAVLGMGLEALREAHAVVVEGRPPQEAFSAGSEVTIVFFSYQFGPYVHLTHVQRRGNTVEVCYQFTPHRTDEITEHFALIPLGKPATAKYDVHVTQVPMEEVYVEQGFRPVSGATAHRIVCRPFSFSVTQRSGD